ncbi:1-phosphofructokinase [Liquorilactobacillus nagelii]|jgi:1-phosphofructokinase|uniref:1-phosphofructokinase n=3 Tax=Liquorilactobacillus nagelii TaxID=82688 RepID=UPI00242E5BF8|nr:1-phosphofructokinase [Liquorilactobacillus nagelii]MCI1700796.1 1-phosphofructokinase [Liquorilactobacillus nagelii]
MIYTVTLNTAIDLFIETESMLPKKVNRTQSYDIQANGKGVNISFILKKLGIDSVAVCAGGGFTADYIQSELNKNRIPSFFVKSEGITRINVFTKVLSENDEYKLVNSGPGLAITQQEKIKSYLKSKLESEDVVCVCGSFPKKVLPSYLIDLAKIVAKKQARLVIDSSYTSVLSTLKYHPWILKPNESELKQWFNVDRELTIEKLVKLAKELVARGAQQILLSLGNRGAVLVTKDKVLYGNAPKVEVVNTAGAGDSMLGTFVANLTKKSGPEVALKRALAAGSGAASQKWITDFDKIDLLENQITISEFS